MDRQREKVRVKDGGYLLPILRLNLTSLAALAASFVPPVSEGERWIVVPAALDGFNRAATDHLGRG